MKNNIFNIFLILNLGYTALHGVPYMKSNYSYSQTFHNENISHIDANGNLLVEECTIINHVSVNGSLTVQKSSIGEIIVNGQASINNSQIKSTTINGTLTAKSSRFSELVNAASTMINFDDCELEYLIIRKAGNSKETQIVKLLGNSQINKDIIFEVPGGEVILSQDAQIHGKVENGTIIRK